MGKFELDRQAISKVVNQDLSERTAEMQRLFDRLRSTQQGKPLSQVKQALKREWERLGPGATISDPELSRYAKEIAEGRQIRVSAEEVRL